MMPPLGSPLYRPLGEIVRGNINGFPYSLATWQDLRALSSPRTMFIAGDPRIPAMQIKTNSKATTPDNAKSKQNRLAR